MKLSTFVADFGNFELKYLDGAGVPRAIRSIHTRLPQGVNSLGHTKNSPIIEANGSRYHFGVKAYEYRTAEKTVITDKALLARLHLYACMEATQGSYRLVLTHHSPEMVTDDLRRALVAKHDFARNGIPHSVIVKAVEVVPEGMGAYWAARQAGFITPDGYTIVIDIGGGTWLYRVVNASGEIIDGDVFDRMGAYSVASQIAHDNRLRSPARKQGFNVDAGRVMDGFAAGNWYEGTRLSWRDWMGEYVEPWFKEIIGTIRSDCVSHLPRVRRFIVTGGGAHLVRDRLQSNSAFIVMPDPSFANVIGMGERYAQAQLEAVA